MRSALLLLLSLGFTLTAAEPDWPSFRGPKRDGLSPDKNLLKSWPVDGPKLLWKAEGVGGGYSSVSVVGDKVLTMGDKDDASYVFAVSRKDGKMLWEAKVGKPGGGGGYPGPRCTPTVDGDSVYAIGQHGDFVCVSLADGKEKWRVDFRADFHGTSGGWQYSESPLVDGENVICTPGGKEATMLALNKKTGKVVWKGFTPDGESAGYSSIVAYTGPGGKQYVTLTSKSVVSFSAKSGKFLWRFGATDKRFAGNTANIPTVILMPTANELFAAAGYGRGGALFQVSSNRGLLDTKEIYWSEKLKNKHGGIIRVGNYLYGDHDDSGRIWCAEAKSGNVMWSRKDREEGSGSASMTYADGLLFVRYQNGWVSLVSANPKEYQSLGSFRVPNGTGNCWAHPVVIGGKLYLREKDTIWCYDVAKN